MAGTYVLGETKVRPGAYFNIQKKGTGQQSGTVSGVTAVLFRSDFGPLNTAVELNPDDGFANTFGNGGTTDAIQEAINGGAQTIIACRVGNGGTSATATLNTAEGQAAVKITAAYPGKKAFTVTVREKLTDSTLKECIIYSVYYTGMRTETQNVRLRSANRGNSNNTWYVNSDGNVNNNNANWANRCAPACVVFRTYGCLTEVVLRPI